MNYLAHLFLSGDSPESITGNLMADFVKGAAIHDLPSAVQTGIRLHRAVDTFTDAHPLHQRSRARLGRRWSRVSGILVDIYYDHLLARDWERFSATPLRHYLDSAYSRFLPCCLSLPATYHETGRWLVGEDLMMTYRDQAGIERALTRLSRRLCEGRFSLEEAMPELIQADDGLSGDFHLFFPELQNFAAEWAGRTNEPCRTPSAL